jgi:hypothetical protein
LLITSRTVYRVLIGNRKAEDISNVYAGATGLLSPHHSEGDFPPGCCPSTKTRIAQGVSTGNYLAL